jgi:hypothetical protein
MRMILYIIKRIINDMFGSLFHMSDVVFNITIIIFMLIAWYVNWALLYLVFDIDQGKSFIGGLSLFGIELLIAIFCSYVYNIYVEYKIKERGKNNGTEWKN